MTAMQHWAKVLTEMTPQQVIDEIKASGLTRPRRRRLPHRYEVAVCGQLPRPHQKYVCCNADEGDPGAFMDRSVLEGDPHVRVGGYGHCRLCHRRNPGLYLCPRRVSHCGAAPPDRSSKQAHEYGLLGENIFDTGFSFDIDIRLGAGAFVCGEETALMASIEGKRGEPRPPSALSRQSRGCSASPPSSTTWRPMPTYRWIINHGADCVCCTWVPRSSKGTKVFALGGKINNTGLVEIPMGTTLRKIIEEIGGGMPERQRSSKQLRPAVLPAAVFRHLRSTFPSTMTTSAAIGAMMGSGGMIVHGRG